MNRSIKRNSEFLFASLFLLFGLFILFTDIRFDINLSDEGFLWTGSLLTLDNFVPLRDFQSYDPGRYYWSAFWLNNLGTSLHDLRLSNTIFRIIGIFLSFLIIKRLFNNKALISLLCLVVILWMLPQHKPFENVIPIAGIYFAIRLVETRNLASLFIAGFICGLAAIFGRNHGIYFVFSFTLLTSTLWLHKLIDFKIQQIGISLAGIIVGYLPLLLMFWFVPDFATAFYESILKHFEAGATNLTRPIPWPWNADLSNIASNKVSQHFFLGILILVQFIFSVFSLILLVFFKKLELIKQPVLAASICFALPYMHYTFSRADFNHLAQGIMPVLFGIFAMYKLCNTNKWLKLGYFTLVIICMSATYYSNIKRHGSYHIFFPQRVLTEYSLNNDQLILPVQKAKFINNIISFTKEHIDRQDKIFIAPNLPGLYPILKKNPINYDFYMISPKTNKYQRKMIEQIKQNNISWILLGDIPYDGRKDMVFSNTHSDVYHYIKKNYIKIKSFGRYSFYQKKSSINSTIKPKTI